MADSVKKCKIKAFCTGSVPGFEIILKLLQENNTTDDEAHFKTENTTKASSIKLIENLKACNKLCIEFIEFFPFWSTERKECIENITAISDQIDHHHRNANVAQLPAAGLGVLSGALVITGIALTPVTFGASLGLTIAGTVIGVASAGTGAGASVTDMVITRRKVKEAHECFEQHKQNTLKLIEMVSKIVQITDKIEKLSTEDTICYIENVVTQSTGALTRVTAFGLVSNVKSVFNLIYSIPEAVAGLKQVCVLITSSPVLHNVLSLVPAQFGTAIAGISAEGAKVSAKIGGQTLTAFSYIGGALGIAISSGVAVYTIYDMIKNENKTDAANKLRELCEQLNREHVDLKTLYRTLVFAMTAEDNDTETHN